MRPEALFREHHGAVYRAAYRITGNAMDAEDVLQTVFTRLLRRERQRPFRERGSYLHRAAVNAALDLMRVASGPVGSTSTRSARIWWTPAIRGRNARSGIRS